MAEPCGVGFMDSRKLYPDEMDEEKHPRDHQVQNSASAGEDLSIGERIGEQVHQSDDDLEHDPESFSARLRKPRPVPSDGNVQLDKGLTRAHARFTRIGCVRNSFSTLFHKAPDIEKQSQPPSPPENESPRRVPNGFPALSQLLSTDPDLQVFRRFDRLATRNLLYLQSELTSLEAQLDDLDSADYADTKNLKPGWLEVARSAQDWDAFAAKSEAEEGRDRQRMHLVRRIRTVLAEYQDALARQSRILHLDHPHARIRHGLHDWFEQNVPLVGHARSVFKSKSDLVALRTPPDQDRLSLFLEDHLGYMLRDRNWRPGHAESEGSIYYYREKTIRRLVSLLSVLLAAVLLVGAIVSLYFVRRMGAKLGMIAAFTTVFAGSVGALTNAKRAEVYAATAAYAAVLVVFVSGSIQNG